MYGRHVWPWGVNVPHVLLVDDHPELLVTVAEALRDRGFTVTEAASRAQANAVLAAGGIDVVVTDFVLPGGNGDEIAEAAQHAGVPVVIMSGDPFRTKRDQGDDLPFIAKPFHSAQLVDLIHSVLAPKPPAN